VNSICIVYNISLVQCSSYPNWKFPVGFEVLLEVALKSFVFWDKILCSWTDFNRLHGVTSQKNFSQFFTCHSRQMSGQYKVGY
jgi:hypothetical protein